MKRTYRLVCMFLVLALVISLSACAPSGVATVDGEQITKDEFNFYLTQKVIAFEQGENMETIQDFWETAEIDGKKAIDAAKERALDDAVKAKLVEIKVKESGIKLTEQDLKMIDERIASDVSQMGGDEAYNVWLQENGLTDQVYRNFLAGSVYQQALTVKIQLTDAEVREFYDNSLAHVKHIVLPVDARETADKVLEKARSGADFDALISEYSANLVSEFPDGYYVGEGFTINAGSVESEYSDANMQSAALEIEIGSVSEIVETENGLYILKRLPGNDAGFESNIDQVRARAQAVKFNQDLIAWQNAAKIVVNEDVLKEIQIQR